MVEQIGGTSIGTRWHEDAGEPEKEKRGGVQILAPFACETNEKWFEKCEIELFEQH